MIEKKITGKNARSVYHLCIKHGFGVHFPLENRCPDCDNETFLYLSAQDIRFILQDEKKKWKEEVMRMIGKDEKKSRGIELSGYYKYEIRNLFRQELRVKLNKEGV